MIVVIFLAIGVVVLFLICKVSGSSNKSDSCINNTRQYDKDGSFRKINGVTIYVSDEELKEQEQIIKDNFIIKKDELRNRIKNDMDATDDCIRKKVLNEILNIPIFVESDYERVKFMYNNGRLRTNSEVHNYDLSKTYTTRRQEYDRSRHKTNIIAFWGPFIPTMLIFCLIFNDIMFFPVALLFALIAGYIGMMIGYKTNVDNAKNFELPANDPSVIDEKRKFTSGVVGGIGAAGSIVHNTKKTVKDISNVDDWKKMK